MSKIATKAAGNIFYKARSQASKFNDKLKSREGAAEELGIDRTRLARIELGSITPYPEEILLMADLYKVPELKCHYCHEECPLGYDIPQITTNELDRITVKAISAFRKVEDTESLLLDITEDGNIEIDEIPKLNQILRNLDELEQVTKNLKVWVEKNIQNL